MTAVVAQRLDQVPPAIRPLTNQQSRELRSRFPDLPMSLEHCPTCRGRKRFSWYLPGSRTETAEYECDCRGQFMLHRAFLMAGIGEAYQRLSWDDFTYITPEAAEAAADYIEHHRAYIAQGIGLVMSGPRGNGKTMLNTLIGKRLVAQGTDVYHTAFNDALSLFTDGWREKDERIWFNSRVRNAGVLCMDDLGRERNKGVGSVGESMLEEVVRHRVSRSKPTNITTNLTQDKIEQGYGGHTMSLLAERSIYVSFSGTDRRAQIADRLKAEVKAGLTRPIVVQ